MVNYWILGGLILTITMIGVMLVDDSIPQTQTTNTEIPGTYLNTSNGTYIVSAVNQSAYEYGFKLNYANVLNAPWLTSFSIPGSYLNTSNNTYLVAAVNASSGYFSNMKVSWDNIQGVPAGFADGVDDTGGGSDMSEYLMNNSIPNCTDTSYKLVKLNNAWQCVQDIKLNVYDLFSKNTYYREAMFESVTGGYNEPWIGAALSSGTTAVGTGEYDHPGVATMSTSTTASSGYCYQITNANTYLIGPHYSTSVTFRPIARSIIAGKPENVTIIRFGFQDIFTAAGVVVDGVFINITQAGSTFTTIGVARNNSVQTVTASTGTLLNNTWYGANIYIESNTSARFTINNATHVVWQDWVTSRIPTTSGRTTSNAFCAHTNGTSVATVIANIDYISVGVNATLAR